jgi:UDP-N-acetylglucosamine--N-acetylmuramyl-(pentapeptide) pyrophosphoryl-undecaprenol N-acetylglucosamine transferase
MKKRAQPKYKACKEPQIGSAKILGTITILKTEYTEQAKKNTSVKIIMAGGGTGGHIFPAVAIANAIKKIVPDADILFVGAKGRMEMEKVPQAGFKIEGLDIAGFNRSSMIKNLSLPFKLVKSFLQVRRIINRFQPDAVVGVGGYSSFPVLKYAQQKGIASFIHESNSFAGRANKMLGSNATRIYVASEGMEQFFPAGKLMITGNPVRASIAQSQISREEGIAYFGLDPRTKTVLSIGGSLGAKSINEAIASGIDAFQQNDLQLIWQTGKPFAEQGKAAVAGRKNIWVSDFITSMEYALAAADLVISRAGAMAIAELSVMKKPVLFVPYPHAAEDHQTVNAANLVKRDAALMIKDNEAAEKMIPAIIALAKDEARLSTLSNNIAGMAFTDADRKVAEDILKSIRK